MDKFKKVGIDLCPMKSGSINGGAKIFIISLIQELVKNSQHRRFFIYVSSYRVKLELNKYLSSTNTRIISRESKSFPLVKRFIRPHELFLKLISRFHNLIFHFYSKSEKLTNKLASDKDQIKEYNLYRITRNTMIQFLVILFKIKIIVI